MEESYKRELKSNTKMFAIGEFFTKILQYIVSLFLSYFLTTSQTGDINLIKTSSLLIIPIVTLDILEAVFAFSADKKHELNSVFTTGVLFIGVGLVLLIPAVIVLEAAFHISVPWIVYLFIGTSLIHNIVHYFIKGTGKIKLYIVNSLLFATGTCLVTLLCLFLFKGGINTYLFCYIGTSAFCIIFMFVFGKLWQYISFKSINKKITFDMVKYSSPLIVNTIGWWLISASDTYITNYFLGNSQVGILSYTHKFPTIMSTLFGVFGMSFQIFSFSKFDLSKKEDARASENVFSEILDKTICVVGLLTLLVIMVAEPMIKFLVNESYYESAKYVSVYLLGTFFFLLSTFYGYIYGLKKSSIPLMISTIICGVINVGLCILFYTFIHNLFAAALSTCISYFVVYLFRAIHSRKFVKLNYEKNKIFALLILFTNVLANSLVTLGTRELFVINLLFVTIYVVVYHNSLITFVKSVFSKNK